MTEMPAPKPTSWFRGIFEHFEAEQTVTVFAGKKRTLTVVDTHLATGREPYRCDAAIVELAGYGTEYQLEIPTSRDRQVTLLYPSSDAVGEAVKTVAFQDGGPAIVSDTTAADLGIPAR